ncbi:2Fe-2S iron-sulfur cluster binding domain-containing protein [Helicobacter muridarum]|uniref:2Fe-2S iron-sulfur cluster binding domain-containing protein n=1 Tax=Helicobacter muridarum TaxID=216 RepID=A0A099TZJ3_9HELI|nr:2Fe-2S iron-sulfur cluster-binding protein [Helicobacter muridarum]TLD99409.1 2Fe-2S iron-sulfur cluster binding domain-containing protein [Helicobacter muridarum]STQ85488.1 NADH dehydrogenase subunit G [Helicobacter muridarum]
MTIKIEGQEFECFDGETILDVARRNNIQIPTICYLSGCSPTLACKMCMVEVNGKRVYSCNAKIKSGMDVVVHNEELQKDRNEIMTTYCVNHPLECGVCDKSGECELQDFTLYTKVDTQLFGLQEADKKSFSFAQSFYDPALCIMCERCVTTCKDNIGENFLKAGKANLFTPDSYKESMGKDPYSVWAKRQKGLIEFIGNYECKDCGECISVCPVGAMTYKDFTYRSNAWELEKVHSTCGLCAGGCNLIYNVKHLDVKGDLQKVYRVQNNYLYNPICGAGRFAFDMVSIGSRNLSSVLAAFKRADCLHLGGDVSNEEALLANLISKKYNIPLVNSEARLYQIFQFYFIQASYFYNNLFSNLQDSAQSSKKEANLSPMDMFATYNDISVSKTTIALHAYFKYQAPSLRYKINNNLKMQKGSQLISIGLFKDSLLQSLSKNVIQIKADSNISIAGILGLIFANDLIDDFEACFPYALQPLLNMSASNKDFALKDSSQESTVDSSSNIGEAKSNGEKIEETKQKDLKPNESIANNLSAYNISLLLDSLNLENLDALKLSKNGGVLIISEHTINDFLQSNLEYIHGYGINLYQDRENPPSIAEAVSLSIAEDITKPIASSLMDSRAKARILAYLLAFLCSKLDLKILYIPSGANVLGIASLCELSAFDISESKCSIGIRAKGDFVLDANLETIKPNFALPTLAQNEGSITSMEMRVLPLNPSVPYLDSKLQPAFDLSDIAREIGIFDDNELDECEYIGDLTKFLHLYSKGWFIYKDIAYEDLNASFDKDGKDNRGYMMITNRNNFSKDAKRPIELKFSLRLASQCNDFGLPNSKFNEALENSQNDKSSIDDSKDSKANFSSNPNTDDMNVARFLAIKLETQNHFNPTTLASKNLQSKSGIHASKSILDELGLEDSNMVVVRSNGGVVIAPIYCDYDLEDCVLVSPMLSGIELLFGDKTHVNVSLQKAKQIELSAV